MKCRISIFALAISCFVLFHEQVKAEPQHWIAASLGASIYISTNYNSESWYAFWSIGFAKINYPGTLHHIESYLENTADNPEIYRPRNNMDMFGTYWPITEHNMLIGWVINVVSDSLVTNNDPKFNYIGDDLLIIDTFLYGISSMKFFGHEIGDGLFIRGDVGLAEYRISNDYGDPVIQETRDSGWGYLAGIGYGFKVFSSSHLLVKLNYSSRHIEHNKIDNYLFSVGLLW